MTSLVDQEEIVADVRADFLKRFYAVAVGVGFASKVTATEFLIQGRFPKFEESKAFALLILAMVVILGSWNFYFLSIHKNNKPLIDWQRFGLDIFIVFLYILLLASVNSINAFFFYAALVLFCYFLWDILSVWKHSSKYGQDLSRYSGVYEICVRGLLDQRREEKGIRSFSPFVTFWWMVVFWLVFFVLYRLNNADFAPWNFLFLWICVFVSYLSYRFDQSLYWSMAQRVFATIIAFLLLAFATFGH